MISSFKCLEGGGDTISWDDVLILLRSVRHGELSAKDLATVANGIKRLAKLNTEVMEIASEERPQDFPPSSTIEEFWAKYNGCAIDAWNSEEKLITFRDNIVASSKKNVPLKDFVLSEERKISLREVWLSEQIHFIYSHKKILTLDIFL